MLTLISVKVGEKRFKHGESFHLPPYSMIICAETKSEDLSVDRSVTLSWIQFLPTFYCEHLSLPSSVTYFYENFMVLFESTFVDRN